MCEIHFIMRVDGKGLDEDDLTELKWITELGGDSNEDATGMFSDGFAHKDGMEATKYFEKYWEKMKPDLLGKPFVVSHNRSGRYGPPDDNKNNHPFIVKSRLGNVIAVHNGSISNDTRIRDEEKLECEGKTDSEIIPRLIAKYIDAGDEPNVAVKKCAEKIVGTYSVFVLVQHRLYYFKNDSPDFMFGLITFADGKKVIVGSTSDKNIALLYQYSAEGIFNKPAYSDVLWQEPIAEQIYVFENFKAEFGDEFTEAEWANSYNNGTGKNQTNFSNYDDDGNERAGSWGMLNGSDSHQPSTTVAALQVINSQLSDHRQSLRTVIEFQVEENALTAEEADVVQRAVNAIKLEDFESTTNPHLIKRIVDRNYADEADSLWNGLSNVDAWMNCCAAYWLTDVEYDAWAKTEGNASMHYRTIATDRAREQYSNAAKNRWATVRDWMTDEETNAWLDLIVDNPRRGDDTIENVKNRILSAKKLNQIDLLDEFD